MIAITGATCSLAHCLAGDPGVRVGILRAVGGDGRRRVRGVHVAHVVVAPSRTWLVGGHRSQGRPTRTALTTARLAAGMSRAVVAAHVGVARGRVHAWENGDSTPHAHQIPALAATVGVAPETLMRDRSLRSRRYATGVTQAEAAAAVGVTQAEAAAAVGVNRAEWSRWEGGLRIPPRFASAVERLVGG